MKILLTGGCGFIGSNILERYLQEGHEVTIVDNFRSGRMENIKHLLDNKNLRCAFGDILDEDFIKGLDEDFDIISHHAAQLEITRCIEFPQEDLTSNLIGTTNIFEHAKRCKNVKKVIYASSAAVYGQAKSSLQKETDDIDPHWIYGVSKYATEMLANIYSKELKIPFVGMRYSIVYGPREWYGRVLTLFIKNSIRDNKIVVFGKGDEVRDYINVKDVVEFNALLLEKNLPNENLPLNVSFGKGITIDKLAHKIQDLTSCELIHEEVEEGKSSKIINVDRVRLPGNLLYLCQDNSKAKEMLNWEPKVDFEVGLIEEIEWYREKSKTDSELWSKMFY